MKSEKFTVAVLAGDGIGPEITAQALKALEAAGRRFGVTFTFDERHVGGAAYDLVHDALPDETLAAAKSADAVLLGAVGGPKWDFLAPELRPERRALLTLSAELGLFANIRPVKMYRTVSTPWPEKESFDYDMVVLFSAANAVSLRENFPDLKQGDKVIAALGNHTSATLREMGITPDIQVPSPKFHSITEAIQDYLENHQE